MSGDNANTTPAIIPASNTSIQNANWSGSIPILLSIAPTSLSSPTPPRPIHKMISRMTYLHLALHDEVMYLSGYAPVFASGLLPAFSGMSVEEPPDDDDDGGGGGGDGSTPTESGEAENGEKKDNSDKKSAPDEKNESSSSTEAADSHSKQQSDTTNKGAAPSYPECWFEDEESGIPLRWHLFVGVLHDLMKGRATIMKKGTTASSTMELTPPNFLPWRIRVHFTSYPTDKLLPLDDGLDTANNSSEEDGQSRITALVKRLFRNSLKQALFMQYASSKVAMSITKHSHEKIWDAVIQSNYGSYHEVNVGLQSGIQSPSIGSTKLTTIPAALGKEEESSDIPQLIPVRLMLNGMPAIQRPTKHEKDNKDVERQRPSEVLKKLGTLQAPPYTTLGDVLSNCLPDYFRVDPSTGLASVASDTAVYYCVQGVQPSLNCAMVDLWRALSHPDHFLYVIVMTE
mmetsp:Transcript_40013/g.84042  ORF Transcript_40013/g.84042 Transcript_40013/m.84042 type:complete len:457 (+) Transcript_40013:163-1533(+)|eukprot:CAMPEP_0183764184 /NCGR_PEP_ID=MMETSP0739-20130205/10158_1 /TAXON_ID=385413 /ORGANISM="Thalassiosira miniscula, Strain CCMP1093" /LENGTH=456 /DNA_ID=CAMNT_0026002691 /DNA_START=79 /DNA_END=1449 /DNA_ORIENTATION=+